MSSNNLVDDQVYRRITEFENLPGIPSYTLLVNINVLYKREPEQVFYIRSISMRNFD